MTTDLQLLTTRQVAEMLGVCLKTVRRWRDAGKLACVQLPGGQYRYRRKDVEQVRLARNGVEPTDRAQDVEAHILAARRKVERLRRSI